MDVNRNEMKNTIQTRICAVSSGVNEYGIRYHTANLKAYESGNTIPLDGVPITREMYERMSNAGFPFSITLTIEINEDQK